MSESKLSCKVLGIGAWGPGFTHWEKLAELLVTDHPFEPEFTKPAPVIIPANERRRAPLLVKLAVETSWQAVKENADAAANIACVFGSGLGDTDVTDYLCKALTTELKQLSPTKFHNSVHNTAAGYWTISTHCMKSANSIAAYQDTVGVVLMEAISQCALQQQPILISLYDTAVSSVLNELFSSDQNLGLSLLIAPSDHPEPGPTLHINTVASAGENTLINTQLAALLANNPCAELLHLLQALALYQQDSSQALGAHFSLSDHSALAVQVR